MVMTAYQKHSISFLSCKDKDEYVNYGKKLRVLELYICFLPSLQDLKSCLSERSLQNNLGHSFSHSEIKAFLHHGHIIL